MKKLLIVLLTFMLFCNMTCFAEIGTTDVIEASASQPLSLEVGDIVTFGHYEQDGDSANGSEPIEWIVLDTDGERATLISRYGLDVMPYNEDGHAGGSAQWKFCSVREWLNTTFLNQAFSADEQARLETSVVTQEGVIPASEDADGELLDMVYLLSTDEAARYFPALWDRKCAATQAAVNKGAGVYEGTSHWWLRTYSNSKRADGVSYSGNIVNSLVEGYAKNVPVRPAIRLLLNGVSSPCNPIRFRDLAWGASWEEISRQVELTGHMGTDSHSLARTMYNGEDIAYDNDICFNSRYADSEIDAIKNVAGQKLLLVDLYFVYVPDENGVLVRDDAHTALYLARYSLDKKADVDGLMKKLTSLYGSPAQTTSEADGSSYNSSAWIDADGACVALHSITNGSYVWLLYASGNMDALLAAATAANIDGL